MKKIYFTCFFLSLFLYATAQIPSMISIEVKTILMKKGKTIASATEKQICYINKNESIESMSWKDTLVWKIRNKDRTPKQVFECFQKNKIDYEVKGTKINMNIKPNFALWTHKPLLPSKYKELIKEESFANNLTFEIKNNGTQNIDYQLDSFSIKQQIALRIPTCINSKISSQNGGLVTVYYRASREHLNKMQASASSAGKAFDWGHAFVGVKDLKTNKVYFLDGWPDGKLEEGKQHFVWNERVDENRTADHHSISFGISAKSVSELISLIQHYRTACIAYELIDFNCTDATTKVLEKIGYYTTKDQSGTILPNTFAKNLMEKLNQKQVCYEFDGYRIK